jgi:hypothetical protein
MRLRPRRAERLYAGHREPRGEVYVVTRDRLRALPHAHFRGDTPFDWGVRDEGALELASALTRDVRRRSTPDDEVLALAADIVAGLPRDGFVLSAEEIRGWLRARRRAARVASPDAWVAAHCWLVPFPWPVAGDAAPRVRRGRPPRAS